MAFGWFTNKRTSANLPHGARAFVRRDGARAIVVTLHRNQHGVHCEEDEASVVDAPTDVSLGEAVIASLRRTSNVERDLRNLKLTDWPAYLASGCRSVRAFKRDFIAIHVYGANEANLIYLIEGEPEEDADMTLTSKISSSAKPEVIGGKILRVFAACRDRRI